MPDSFVLWGFEAQKRSLTEAESPCLRLDTEAYSIYHKNGWHLFEADARKAWAAIWLAMLNLCKGAMHGDELCGAFRQA